MLNVMKEIIGNKRVINVLLPNFMTVKNIEVFDKKEIVGTITNYFVNIDTNLAASLLESRTIFQDYIHYNVPCHSTINLTVLELENAFASLKTNKSSGYDNISSNVVKKSIGGNICYSETYFQYLFRNRVFPVKLKIYRVRPIFKKRNSTLEPTIDQTQYYPAFQNYLNA